MALDSDNDGVVDLYDLEPQTPHNQHVHKPSEPNDASNCLVNSQGIAIDSDRDGIPDCVDAEKNSPFNAKVNDQGVAQKEVPQVVVKTTKEDEEIDPSSPFSNRIDLEEMVDNDDDWTYYVVVGVFRDKGNVLRYQKHLTKHYYENTKIVLTSQNYNYVWTKIVVTREEASTEIQRLKAKSIEEYIVGNPWLWREHK